MTGPLADPPEQGRSSPLPPLGPAVSRPAPAAGSPLGSASEPLPPFAPARGAGGARPPEVDALPAAAPEPSIVDEIFPWLTPVDALGGPYLDLPASEPAAPQPTESTESAELDVARGGEWDRASEFPEADVFGGAESVPDEVLRGWWDEVPEPEPPAPLPLMQHREDAGTTAGEEMSAQPESARDARRLDAAEAADVALPSGAVQAAGGEPLLLDELAARLERIAHGLRARRTAELFGAEAAPDPLELLVTGYALGYSEAIRKAAERSRREGA